MTKFKPRLTKPEKGNPYYNTIANGGLSPAIKGKPTDSDCDVLSNCVGYAIGRFNEIGGEGFKNLKSVDAQHFIKYAGKCKVGFTPKVGACMVWENTAKNSGHVAIVEQVVSDTEVVTSESGWGCAIPFWTQHLKKGDGNWSQPKGYTFLGFIYNPALEEIPEKADDKPDSPPLYRVRMAWDKAGSQIGAFASLRNAVNSCPMKFKVYDNYGNVVYAEPHLLPDRNPFEQPVVVPKYGDSGDTVKWLQYALIIRGYSCGESGIDGEYGKYTDLAVKAFSTVNGVSAEDLIIELGGVT